MATDLLAPFFLKFIYDRRKPKSCSKYPLMSVCFKFLNVLTGEALCLHSVMLRLSSAYFSFTCTRHLGSGKHPSRFHEHGYAEGPGKLRRLTKGVSISLPSSPLFPRQTDIVPSQSCIRFTGG